MGINFSHCDASWSYSGFMRFRIEVAAAEGLLLQEMAGFRGMREDTAPLAPSRAWSTVDSPLVPFLNHSDCDGHLCSEQCAAVEPRLRQVVEGMTDPYDRANGLRLCDGMRSAAAAGERLEFR